MPVITFPFKKSLVGVRVKLPNLEGVWEIVEVCPYSPAVKLVLEDDMRLEPGRSKRSTTMPIQEAEKLIDSPALVSKPATATPTFFVIFGHKSEAGFEPNEAELEELERLGMTMLENRNTNESWFGKVLRGDESAKEMAAIKHILNVECNMRGLPLETYHVDFLQKTS